MKVVCYFAAAEGVHPHCTVAEYDEIWPVMQASVERQGYELIHLTGREDKARCKTVLRYDIDPAVVMYSREVAWAGFLETLEDGEQAVLVEPDAYLLRPIPPLRDDKDMLLLRRPGKSLPSGFRLAKRSALPFYREVVRVYSGMSDGLKKLHGDVAAQQQVLGVLPRGAGDLPAQWGSVHFEHRFFGEYTSKMLEGAVAWNFKGRSKEQMLKMARKGRFQEMR